MSAAVPAFCGADTSTGCSFRKSRPALTTLKGIMKPKRTKFVGRAKLVKWSSGGLSVDDLILYARQNAKKKLVEEVKPKREFPERPEKKKCAFCGMFFKGKTNEVLSRWEKRKYCSHECFSRSLIPKDRKGRLTNRCKLCGKEFGKNPRKSWAMFSKQKYCSNICSSKERERAKKCEFCKGKYTRRYKESKRDWDRRKFCSDICRKKASATVITETEKECEICGFMMKKNKKCSWDDWNSRRFCSRKCASFARAWEKK